MRVRSVWRPSRPPAVLTGATGSSARVGQVGGDEKTNSRLGQHTMAATLGTDMEGAFTLRAAKKQLEKRQRLNTTGPGSRDGHRFAWAAYGSPGDWFSGRKAFLMGKLSGTPEPTTPPGGQVAELTMRRKLLGASPTRTRPTTGAGSLEFI